MSHDAYRAAKEVINMYEEITSLQKEIGRLANRTETEVHADLITTIRYLVGTLHKTKGLIFPDLGEEQVYHIQDLLRNVLGNESSAYVWLNQCNVHSPDYLNSLIERAKAKEGSRRLILTRGRWLDDRPM